MGKIVISGPQNVSLDGVVQDQLGRTLIKHDLADELRLVVFPVVLGVGERLFGETSGMKPMRLVDAKTIGDGLAFLTYQFIRDP